MTAPSRPSHTCPSCGQQFSQVRDALACWLKASPDALRTRSLGEAALLLSCSHERVRQVAKALGIDTSLAAKEPGFQSRASTGARGHVGPRSRPSTPEERERGRRAWQALLANPERHAAYLERRRKRARDRWRSDPDYRQASKESNYRWRRKRQQQRGE